MSKLLLGGEVDDQAYLAWIVKPEVAELQKAANLVVSGLVAKLSFVSGTLGLILSTVLKCPKTGILILLMFVGVGVGLNAIFKMAGYMELQEIGVRLEKSYFDTYLDVVKRPAVRASLVGLIDEARLHQEEILMAMERQISPKISSWKFVITYLVQIVGIALMFMMGESFYWMSFRHCKKN